MTTENPLSFPEIDKKLLEEDGVVSLEAYFPGDGKPHSPMDFSVTLYKRYPGQKVLVPLKHGHYSTLIESLEEIEEALKGREISHAYGRGSRPEEVKRRLNMLLMKNPAYGLRASRIEGGIGTGISTLYFQNPKKRQEFISITKPTFSQGLMALDEIDIPDNVLDYVLLGTETGKIGERVLPIVERMARRRYW